MKKTLLMILAMAITACATTHSPPPTIDGSSKESTEASLQQMMASLSNKEHCLLQAAVIRIRLGNPILNAGNKFGEALNGLTSKQIMMLSEQYPPKVIPLCKD